MEGRRLNRMSVGIPDAVRKLFLRDGHRLLGLRASTVGAVTLGITLLGWYATTPAQGLKEFAAANAVYLTGEYQAAIPMYEAAIRKNPQLGEAYFYLGNCYDNLYRPARRGDPDNDALLLKAVENYRIGADRSSRPEFKQYSLEYLIAAYGADKLNDFATAEPLIRQLIATNPDELSGYLALTGLYEDAGRYADAEAAFMKVRDRLPPSPDIERAIAVFYHRQGHFDKAMAALRKAADLDPKNPEGYSIVGTYYQEKVTLDQSLSTSAKRQYALDGIEALDRALALRADYYEAIVFKSVLLRALAQVETNRPRRADYLTQADQLLKRASQLRTVK
jgi:tetratricopeptide (TPR) repeat protein